MKTGYSSEHRSSSSGRNFDRTFSISLICFWKSSVIFHPFIEGPHVITAPPSNIPEIVTYKGNQSEKLLSFLQWWDGVEKEEWEGKGECGGERGRRRRTVVGREWGIGSREGNECIKFSGYLLWWEVTTSFHCTHCCHLELCVDAMQEGSLRFPKYLGKENIRTSIK